MRKTLYRCIVKYGMTQDLCISCEDEGKFEYAHWTVCDLFEINSFYFCSGCLVEFLAFPEEVEVYASSLDREYMESISQIMAAEYGTKSTVFTREDI